MSYEIEREEIQAEIDALMDSFSEGDGMTCLSVSNVAVSNVEEGTEI